MASMSRFSDTRLSPCLAMYSTIFRGNTSPFQSCRQSRQTKSPNLGKREWRQGRAVRAVRVWARIRKFVGILLSRAKIAIRSGEDDVPATLVELLRRRQLTCGTAVAENLALADGVCESSGDLLPRDCLSLGRVQIRTHLAHGTTKVRPDGQKSDRTDRERGGWRT